MKNLKITSGTNLVDIVGDSIELSTEDYIHYLEVMEEVDSILESEPRAETEGYWANRVYHDQRQAVCALEEELDRKYNTRFRLL